MEMSIIKPMVTQQVFPELLKIRRACSEAAAPITLETIQTIIHGNRIKAAFISIWQKLLAMFSIKKNSHDEATHDVLYPLLYFKGTIKTCDVPTCYTTNKIIDDVRYSPVQSTCLAHQDYTIYEIHEELCSVGFTQPCQYKVTVLIKKNNSDEPYTPLTTLIFDPRDPREVEVYQGQSFLALFSALAQEIRKDQLNWHPNDLIDQEGLSNYVQAQEENKLKELDATISELTSAHEGIYPYLEYLSEQITSFSRCRSAIERDGLTAGILIEYQKKYHTALSRQQEIKSLLKQAEQEKEKSEKRLMQIKQLETSPILPR